MRTLLQMAIGAAIIVRVGFVAADVIASYPLTIGSEPLRSVGIGLLFSTAVELAYLLYTHGPDEAIDPVITGVAALLLIRAPSPTQILDATTARTLELLVYGAIIVMLFWARERFERSQRERNDRQR